MFRIYVGKRRNCRGLVELSLRFRCGRVDQRASTNLWIPPVVPDKAAGGYRGKGVAVSACNGVPGCDVIPADASAERARLMRMMVYVEEAYFALRGKGIDRGWLADTIDRFNEAERPRLSAGRTVVTDLIDDFMEATWSPDCSESRTVGYALMRRSVARFEEFRRLRVARYSLTVERLDDVSLRALENFMLREDVWVRRYPRLVSGAGLEGLTRARSRNTVNDRMKLLKAVMNWAVKTGRITGNPFDTYVSGRNVYGPPVYLTLEERRRIEACDLSAHPKLALQRDLFVFQCCVGCRVSDLMSLSKSNIVDGELIYVARKTRGESPQTIRVPLNRTASEVLRRYAGLAGDRLFPAVCSRVCYNAAIKEILKLAGIDRKVLVINPLTREAECRRLYETGSSHMARRTFIGNIYKKFKDQRLVSELSGHAAGSNAFARYREIDSDMRREMVESIE